MGYQSIYNRLRANDLSPNGALALLGNWDCESNCESVRVQGDFSPMRTVSKTYVEDIATGRLSRESFMRDSKGFGLAQWTFFTRKGALYDFWKNRGGSIGDESLQVDFAIWELQNDFPGLLAELKSNCDLYTAVRDVCYKYENPATKNVDARFASAKRIQGEIALTGKETLVTPEPAKPDIVVTSSTHVPQYWPPRTIDKNMRGDDVAVLQALLKARGYDVTAIDGIFGSYLDVQVRVFQAAMDLTVDGVVGPLTWTKLLERR